VRVYACISLYKLMPSLKIWISFIVSAMEILSLHWGNTSSDIQTGEDLIIQYFKRFTEPERTRHSYAACTCWAWKGQCAGWGGRVRYLTWHPINQHSSDFLCNILWVLYGVLYVRISCIPSMHNQYKGCRQRTDAPVSSFHFHVGCYGRLRTPLNCCAECCELTR
jgi:hypothetical protein